MFYSDANRKLFEAMKSLYEQKIPLDSTTILDELDKKKNLNSIGGVEYISEVIDSVATAANLEYYIKIVKEKALVRNLINTATEIIIITSHNANVFIPFFKIISSFDLLSTK